MDLKEEKLGENFAIVDKIISFKQFIKEENGFFHRIEFSRTQRDVYRP